VTFYNPRKILLFAAAFLFTFSLIGAGPDSTTIIKKLETVWPMHYRNIDSAIELSRQCYFDARQLGHERTLLRSLHVLGVIEQESGNIPASLNYLDTALKLATKLNDHQRIGQIYNSIGASYSHQGNWKTSIKYMSLAARYKEAHGDIRGSVTSNLNIAVQYLQINDTASTIRYAEKAVDICTKNKFADGYGQAITMMGEIYLYANYLDKAENCFHSALDTINIEAEPVKGIDIYKGLSQIYYLREEATKCFEAVQQMDKLIGISGKKSDLMWLYQGYAQYYFLVKDYKKSEANARLSIDIAKVTGSLHDVSATLDIYVKALKAQNKIAEALEAFELMSHIKDSVSSQNNNESLRRLQAEYEYDRKENEIKSLNNKSLLKETELKQKNYLIIIGIIGIIIICGALVLVFRSYNKSKKTLRLLKVRTKEVEEKNNIITNKNKDITDSIFYAKRIQDTFLPDLGGTNKLLNEFFVLYEPKDILSGDFYWFGEKAGKKIIAVADCTGHGVPGAFLSIAGSAFLNEIINERGISQPQEILSELRHLVIKSLKQTGAEGEARDGMDIGIICIDESKKKIEFAGANNSLIVARSASDKVSADDKTFEEIKGDRRPVGYFRGRGLPFTGVEVNYESGDCIYMFTDGMPDQFGGAHGKKFKRKNLVQLLVSNKQLSITEQKEKLSGVFNDWKGKLEQTDDVLIFGARL
jgi:serine phosphatase RsbU (regulator of sigma subunit)